MICDKYCKILIFGGYLYLAILAVKRRKSKSFSSLPLNHSRRVVVSYKRNMCTKYLLTACSSLEKVWLGKLTVMTIAVDLGSKATKTNNPVI